MADDFEYVCVPRDTVNDDTVILLEWFQLDGAEIKVDDKLCEIETSKATVEVFAERVGWLFHLVEAGTEVPVGRPVGMIADQARRPQISAAPAESGAGELKMTRKARQLMAEHQLESSLFSGSQLVRERDVQRVLRGQAPSAAGGMPPGSPVGLTPIQRRVARVLTESASSIPHSYVSRWLQADACENHLSELCRRYDLTASLADLLVCAAARAAGQFSKANAAWGEPEYISYQQVNVGFALNLASGDLVVPVLKSADQLSFEAVVAGIRDFQRKALRKKLSPADLTGGTLTVTSLTGSGVQQVHPLIVPGQSIILGLADVGDGPCGRAYCLTAGFDHRVLNGSEAARFLAHVAGLMEKELPA